MRKRSFTYELTFAAIATLGTSTASFTVETAFDFYWTKAQAFIYDANGLGVSTLQLPLLTALLQDGSNNQSYSNQTAAIPAMFGCGGIPYVLPAPHCIVGGSTVNGTVTNSHNATTYSVRLQFSGVHVAAGSPSPFEPKPQPPRRAA